MTRLRLGLSLLTLTSLFSPSLRAEEGMWTFDNLPTKALKAFCPKQGYYPATLQLLSLVAAVESAPAMCLG